MTRIALSIRFVLLSTILALFSSFAMAQYGASLEGTVTDKSGAVVAGATVTATDQATGVSLSTLASDAGFYRIPDLTPGAYRVDVEAASFKKGTTTDVHVGAESTRGLNVVLTAGAAQESITVTAGAAVLETENANVSGGIAARQVEELPAFGRDPTSYCASLPASSATVLPAAMHTQRFFRTALAPAAPATPTIRWRTKPRPAPT